MPDRLRPKVWTRNFVLVSFANFWHVASLTTVMTALPLYVKSFGGDAVAVGLVMGIPQLASLVARPLGGWAVDVWGSKRFIVVGSLVFAVATAVCSQTAEASSLVVVRLVQSIGNGIAWIAVSVIAVDLVPGERRGEGLGFFSVFTNLAVALAPAFSIWLISVQGLVVDGFTLMFLSSAALAVLPLLLTLFIPEPRRPPSLAGTAPSLRLRNLVAFGAVPAAIAMLLGAIPYAVISAFLPLYVGGRNTALFFFCSAIVTVCSRPFAGIASDRFGRRPVSIPGIALCAGGVAILAVSPGSVTVVVAAVIFGLGWGVLYPSLLALATDEVPPRQRGAAVGTFNVAMDTSFVVGMVFSGLVAQAIGYPALFLIAAGSATLGLVYLLYYPRLVRKSPTKALPVLRTGDGA